MSLTVNKYNSKFKEEWDEFVDDSKNATFLFKRDFMDYHENRFVDYSLMIFEGDKLLAILPANIVESQTVISHSGLTYGGLLIGKDIKLKKYLNIFSQILFYFKENNITLFKYKSLPIFYTDLPAQEEEYAMFILKAINYRTDTTLTIQNPNIIPYQTRRIRSIKKANKYNLTIKDGDSFELFWSQILEPHLKSRYNKKPTHSLAEINLLASSFPNNISQHNIFDEDDNIIAGCTVFETITTAHVQYIASNEIGRNTGGIDKLFDYLITDAFKDKQYFDFGICNEEEGLYINDGLLDWKEGFGGRTFVHKYFSIDPNNYNLLKTIL